MCANHIQGLDNLVLPRDTKVSGIPGHLPWGEMGATGVDTERGKQCMLPQISTPSVGAGGRRRALHPFHSLLQGEVLTSSHSRCPCFPGSSSNRQWSQSPQWQQQLPQWCQHTELCSWMLRGKGGVSRGSDVRGDQHNHCTSDPPTRPRLGGSHICLTAASGSSSVLGSTGAVSYWRGGAPGSEHLLFFVYKV